jgi:hypothetical protein
MADDKPCCAAEALRRIRHVEINGIKTGIVMLDESIAEVRAHNLANEQEIRAALLKKIRIFNYVPRAAEEAYARALVEEYNKSSVKS